MPSDFVLQKMREREALKNPVKEIEEPEEDEDEEEEEEEVETSPESPPKKSHHAIGERSSHRPRAISGSPRSSSGSLTDKATKFFKNLGPTQTVLLIGGGLLVANHLMVPRGTSVLSQILSAIAPAPKARPRPMYRAGVRAPQPGPPPVDPSGCGPDTMWDPDKHACVPVLPWPIQQASGASRVLAGANWGAGWNHGNKPYGPWAHADPGGPSPYAHAESWGW